MNALNMHGAGIFNPASPLYARLFYGPEQVQKQIAKADEIIYETITQKIDGENIERKIKLLEREGKRLETEGNHKLAKDVRELADALKYYSEDLDNPDDTHRKAPKRKWLAEDYQRLKNYIAEHPRLARAIKIAGVAAAIGLLILGAYLSAYTTEISYPLEKSSISHEAGIFSQNITYGVSTKDIKENNLPLAEVFDNLYNDAKYFALKGEDKPNDTILNTFLSLHARGRNSMVKSGYPYDRVYDNDLEALVIATKDALSDKLVIATEGKLADACLEKLVRNLTGAKNVQVQNYIISGDVNGSVGYCFCEPKIKQCELRGDWVKNASREIEQRVRAKERADIFKIFGLNPEQVKYIEDMAGLRLNTSDADIERAFNLLKVVDLDELSEEKNKDTELIIGILRLGYSLPDARMIINSGVLYRQGTPNFGINSTGYLQDQPYNELEKYRQDNIRDRAAFVAGLLAKNKDYYKAGDREFVCKDFANYFCAMFDYVSNNSFATMVGGSASPLENQPHSWAAIFSSGGQVSFVDPTRYEANNCQRESLNAIDSAHCPYITTKGSHVVIAEIKQPKITTYTAPRISEFIKETKIPAKIKPYEQMALPLILSSPAPLIACDLLASKKKK